MYQQARDNEISQWAPREGTAQHSRLAQTVAVSADGSEIARRPWTAEYKGRAQGKQCQGKNDTCKGWKTQGSNLCIGCQRHEAKLAGTAS